MHSPDGFFWCCARFTTLLHDSPHSLGSLRLREDLQVHISIYFLRFSLPQQVHEGVWCCRTFCKFNCSRTPAGAVCCLSCLIAQFSNVLFFSPKGLYQIGAEWTLHRVQGVFQTIFDIRHSLSFLGFFLSISVFSCFNIIMVAVRRSSAHHCNE